MAKDAAFGTQPTSRPTPPGRNFPAGLANRIRTPIRSPTEDDAETLTYARPNSIADGRSVIAADLIAFAMMVPKVHRDPDSETLSTYALASVGGALAAGAVAAPDLSMLLDPAYYCLVNAAAAILIHRRRISLRGSRDLWRFS